MYPPYIEIDVKFASGPQTIRALDKREYLLIIRDNFC